MARGESSAISPGVPQPGLLDRPGRRWLRLHPVGLAVGTAFAVLAMTPSLVPRDWVFQGVVSGISAAVGYGVGVILVWMLGRSARWRRVSDRVRRRLPRWVPASAWVVLLILVPVALGAMLVIAAGWQRQITALMGMEQTTTTGWSRAGPLLVVVAALLLALARGIRRFARLVARSLHRWVRLPRRLAVVIGAVLAGFLIVTVVNDVVLRRTLSVADSAFSGIDSGTYSGVQQPQRATRSGSPASLVPWDTLGWQGRSFVAGGRPPEQLTAAGAGTAQDPIRTYVGLASAPSPQ